MSDLDLLQSYVRDQSQTAFAALVARHVDLVYSTALRQLRSTALAEDVAQTVFLELARRAAQIETGRPLAPWLYVVTCRSAADLVRSERRRLARENAAAEIAAMKTSPSPSWAQVEGLVDDAMKSLNEADRAAIVLRFFQNLPLRDVGATLGISDDAAQKRVSRALDQLRGFFLRRGIAVTAAGLATDLSAHAIASAPAKLGPAIVAGIGSAPSVVAVSTLAFTMTLLEKTILTAALIITVGGALFETNTLRIARREVAETRQQIDQLVAQTTNARRRLALATRGSQASVPSVAAVPSAADAAIEVTLNAWLGRAARLQQLVRDRPELAIPEFEVLTFSQWLEASREFKAGTEKEILGTLANLRALAERYFVRKIHPALSAYLAAHNNIFPADTSELLPYFTRPIPAAVLARYKIATGETTPSSPRPVIEQKTPVDPLRDSVWTITEGSARATSGLDAVMNKAQQDFLQAHPGVQPKKISDLKPFLPENVDIEMLEARYNSQR